MNIPRRTAATRTPSARRDSTPTQTRLSVGGWSRWGALLALLALVACLGVGCKSDAGGAGGADDGKGSAGRKRVVATTTMIADLARQVGGDDVEVIGLLKPGSDPHLYQPTPGDAKVIARGDLILTNGLKLEGWIDDLVRNAGSKGEVVVVSKGVDPLKAMDKTGYPDPHIWHDAEVWAKAADNVRDALIKLDPAHTKDYTERAAAHADKLKAAHAKIRAEIEKIPKERRVLVTSHDAFQYYGRAYGIEVVAVQGVSTESEAGAQDVARLIETVRSRKVPAVFVETSVNPKLIEQISRETGAKVGGTLYSDALGPSGSGADTMLGMLESNTATIVKALGAP